MIWSAMSIPNDLPALDALTRERARLLLCGKAAINTLSGYNYDWHAFTRWCECVQAEVLPATSETVSLYTTNLLSTRNLKVSSVRRHVAAIAYMHRDAGLVSPITEEIRKLLRGARRIRCE